MTRTPSSSCGTSCFSWHLRHALALDVCPALHQPRCSSWSSAGELPFDTCAGATGSFCASRGSSHPVALGVIVHIVLPVELVTCGRLGLFTRRTCAGMTCGGSGLQQDCLVLSSHNGFFELFVIGLFSFVNCLMPYNIITHDSIIVNRETQIEYRSAPPNKRQGASIKR